MVPNVDDDVQPEPAMRCDRFIESRVPDRDHWLQSGTFSTGPQADPRPEFRGRDFEDVGVDSKIHPDAVEGLLDSLRDAGFSRTRRAVQDYDVPGRDHRLLPRTRPASTARHDPIEIAATDGDRR